MLTGWIINGAFSPSPAGADVGYHLSLKSVTAGISSYEDRCSSPEQDEAASKPTPYSPSLQPGPVNLPPTGPFFPIPTEKGQSFFIKLCFSDFIVFSLFCHP